MVALILALAGCTHLATVDGAIPLAPGSGVFISEVQLARAPNPLGTPTAIPLPAVAFHYRRGLGPDLDGGVHVLTGGLGVDVRYRFFEENGWHVATQPSLSGFFVPWTTFHFGHLDVSLPVRAEHMLGEHWSVAGGPAVTARQVFFGAKVEELRSRGATFELYTGGGLRVQRAGERVRFGFSADLHVDALRGTGLYGGVGFDLGIQRPASAGKP